MPPRICPYVFLSKFFRAADVDFCRIPPAGSDGRNVGEGCMHKKKEEGQIALSLLLGGGYLLSHFRSTIGVVRLNFSVRNGKRWDPHAITTLVHLFSGPHGHRDIIKIIDRKRFAPHRPLRRVQAHKLESCRKDSARKASPSLFRLRFSATFQFLCKKAFGELVLLG